MPTRGDLTDTRGRYTLKGAALAPWEPFRESPTIRYGVCFLDRIDAHHWAERPAWLDYLPLVWTRLDAQGDQGYMRRTWKLEQGASGPVYREQAPTRYEYVPGKPGTAGGKAIAEQAWKGVPGSSKGTKRPRNARPVEVVSLDDEEAWAHEPVDDQGA